jgi:hypothetical protein
MGLTKERMSEFEMDGECVHREVVIPFRAEYQRHEGIFRCGVRLLLLSAEDIGKNE